MKLREKHMADRRRRILDAAEQLIHQTGGADFSMLSLSNHAEVSPATPYNLFGSKPQLLFALFNRWLAEVPVKDLTASYKDPLDRLLETTRVVAAHLAKLSADTKQKTVPATDTAPRSQRVTSILSAIVSIVANVTTFH